jgi:hypothetical protein
VRIDTDTFGTLYHEAFHQYIHYACGELPPHPWFNEGHGEYFGGARIKDGKVRSIDVVPESARVIARAVDQGRHVPWKEMIRYEQGQYCNPDKVEICYAQGWSMIFFLRRSPELEKHPEWARIIPTYFQTLRDAYRAALAALPEGGNGADRLALAKAGFEARQQALDAAFYGVDLAEIEKAWIEFVLRVGGAPRPLRELEKSRGPDLGWRRGCIISTDRGRLQLDVVRFPRDLLLGPGYPGDSRGRSGCSASVCSPGTAAGQFARRRRLRDVRLGGETSSSSRRRAGRVSRWLMEVVAARGRQGRAGSRRATLTASTRFRRSRDRTSSSAGIPRSIPRRAAGVRGSTRSFHASLRATSSSFLGSGRL